MKNIIKVKVADLQQHPEGSRIYSPSDVSELKNLIMIWGLLQPIVINQHNQVLVGWRRLQAIIMLGWQELEVEVVDVPRDEEAAFIVNSNSQRQKTNMEIYKEIKVLKVYWSKKQGTRTDLMDGLSENERLTTRERISKSIGVPETTIHKIETVGDKNSDFLTLVDKGTLGSLSEAYEACKLEKPKHEEEIVEIDLTEIKTCKFCGSVPRRIDTDGKGNLIFKNN